MASNYLSKGVKRTALSVALAACFVGGVQAQSNSSGSIFGSAEPGTTILIQSAETGVTREISADASGRYRATSLPVGNYTVIQKRDGQNIATRENITVRLGAGSEVSFAAASTGEGAQTLDTITVTGMGASPIDVSATDTRIVFTSEQLEKMTVGRSIESIALLTPGVVAADSRYGNTASFSGSAASENAFYINGYAVTNPLTNLGSTTLPFDGISQFQAITGGYGAEFGRATGGVVNIITKRGTNEWKAGGTVIWNPEGLREKQRSIYYPNNGTANDGLSYHNLRERTVNSVTYGAYVGGPIVKDRLFFYASGEFEKRDVDTVLARPGGVAGYQELDYEVPRWLAKFDWNITDNHLLEVTAVSDTTKRSDAQYAYYYAAGANPYGLAPFQKGPRTGGHYYEDGGELYIGKYTGYITDNLTITALYGEQEQDHISLPSGYDPSVVYVSDSRPGGNVSAGSVAQLDFADAYDKTKGGRFDVEWRVSDHTLRLGYDRQDSESNSGEETSGPGYRWQYATMGPDAANQPIPGAGGAVGPGGNGDYVMRYVYANGGTFKVEQEAYYLEDRWQVTDRWLLTLGIRNESFSNYNGDGIIYIEQKDQWAPRLGVSWDVFGDSTLKFFANAGRYHLALPTSVAKRAASPSLYTIEYFGFSGIDPATGIPQGLRPLGDGPYSSNNEYGQAPDPRTAAAKGLKSHFQDEFVFGFEKQLGESFNIGARYVYRDLKSAIDDVCDGRAAYAWGRRNGYSEAASESFKETLDGCLMFNPGEDNTFYLDDGTGNLVAVPLTAQELGFPKLKRVYQGLDIFLEHPFDGSWYYKIDYTFSKNYGNAEGQLNSDIGQTDISATQSWDHPEMMEYAGGYLPNDRRHYLKAFGYYQINPEWRVAATFTAASGRPRNCTGYYNGKNANDPDINEVVYAGPYYFFCNNEPSPRGSQGRLPWTTNLDMGVSYAPNFADNKLQFSLSMFNVLNKQTVQNVVEYGENGGPGQPYHSTGRAVSYSAPRSVRFDVRYDF